MLSSGASRFALVGPGLSSPRTVPYRGFGVPLWETAGAVPTLDLNFAENRTLLDSVTGQNLVTFTRASAGTYVGSDGLIKTAAVNEPRFDHNPTTGESLGLLVEEQSTNLLLRSEEFDNAAWTAIVGGPVVTANYSTAPNGQQVADRLVFDAADKGLSQSITGATIGAVYTASVYIKGTAGQTIRLSPNGGIGTATNVTLSANWQRFTISGAATGTTVGLNINTFGGATARDVEVWGAQLEAGSFPTSYIPTTAAAATRSADVASIGGSAFSGWFNANDGSVYADSLVLYTPGSTKFCWGMSGGSYETSLRQPQGTGSQFRAVIGGTFTAAPGTGGTATDGSTTKAFVAWSGTAGRLQVRSSFSDATAASIPDPSQIGFGPHNGTIKRFTFWPQRLSNTTLQSITA